MEGTKEQQHSLFNAENHQSPPQEQLGLGFQKPTSTNPHDPTLHPLPADNHDDEHQNLAFDEEEKVCTLVFAPALDEEGERKLAVDEENHQQLVQKEEALINEALQLESSNQAIDGEKVSYNALSDDLRDRASIEFIDEAPEKSRDTKNGGANDEEIDRKEYDKAKSEREPEICPVLEENEAENMELKGSSTDKHGSEFENEEGNDTIKVKEEKEQGTIDYYENNCSRTENGENNVRRFEGKEEQGIFGNYEDETSENEQVDEESNGYGHVEGDCVVLKDEKYRMYHYPLRPDAEDCSYYMKTGTCKFGSNCKFNHPLRRRNQTAKETFKQKEENSDMLGQTECKYYLTSGGCKYGKACKYNHSRGKTVVAPILEFNFLGLPIRPGEKECPYYMRNGSCKYGSNCRFNHPDPTAVGGGDPLSGFGDSSAQGGSKDAISGCASARTSDKTAPFVPVTYPHTPGAPNPEWKGYQAPAYPTSERSLPTPPAFTMNIPESSLPTPAFAMNIPERSLPTPVFAMNIPERRLPTPVFAMNIPERRLPTPPAFPMNIPATDTNFYTHHQEQILVEEFPERPGQPECSYFMKTGDCKYRSGCKFHHPKNRIPKTSSFAFSDQGLPLRPDQNICTHYSRYGICKFGPACKYDHPLTYGNSTSSAGSGPGQPPQYGNSANAGGEW